jgi:hypothetical protein
MATGFNFNYGNSVKSVENPEIVSRGKKAVDEANQVDSARDNAFKALNETKQQASFNTQAQATPPKSSAAAAVQMPPSSSGRQSNEFGRALARSGPTESKMGRGGQRFTEGDFKGLTQAQAYEQFFYGNKNNSMGSLPGPSPSPMPMMAAASVMQPQGGPGSMPGQAAANTNAPRFDADGNAIAPAEGYTRFGQPIDITKDRYGNPVNPYRYHDQTRDGFRPTGMGGKSASAPFTLRSEGARLEREAAYQFNERQRGNALAAAGAQAVAEKKQQMQAEKERQNMAIAETGQFTNKDGMTTFYDKGDRQRAQASVDLANQARIVGKQDGRMDEARQLAKTSGELSRVGAPSSPGRATYMQNEYGQGMSGASLIEVPREGQMSLEESSNVLKGNYTPEQIAAARSVPESMGGSDAFLADLNREAGARLDQGMQDTLMDQYGGGRIQQQNRDLDAGPTTKEATPAFQTFRPQTDEELDSMNGQVSFRNTATR